MKRLLAYMLIVLGLGLVVSVHAKAIELKKIYKLEHCSSGSASDFDLIINLELNTITKSNPRKTYKEYLLGTYPIDKIRGIYLANIKNDF